MGAETLKFDGDIGRAHHHRQNKGHACKPSSLGYLGHPGQIGGWWVPQNDVTMEAVRADDYYAITPAGVLCTAHHAQVVRCCGVRTAPPSASLPTRDQ